MFLSVLALSLAAAPCELPRPLAGWSRAGRGLDTGHAVLLAPRDGRIATTVRIRTAGVFGVAIDRDGWIDVAPEGGKPLRIASQGGAPRCSGIRKIVRFSLKPGSYRVTVEKLRGERTKLMLVHGEVARARRSG